MSQAGSFKLKCIVKQDNDPLHSAMLTIAHLAKRFQPPPDIQPIENLSSVIKKMYMFLMTDINFKENIKQYSRKEDCDAKSET